MNGNHLTVSDMVGGVRARDRAVLGKAITLVESDRAEHHETAQELLDALLPFCGGAHRVGISGVPGVGKSTFIDGFGCRLVDEGHTVAVLAVDPSSQRSKGSILGDKTRMERLASSDAAFIRPSPTTGSLGGVGRKTRETILVCEAAGFDIVLVETVGVGQSETLVADMVDVFLVLMLAGAGDELQGIKRGILELADIVAVNKADGDNVPAANRARAEYEAALRIFRPPGHSDWDPRVVTCSAFSGAGLTEVWGLIRDHRRCLDERGLLDRKRSEQRLKWMWSMIDEAVMKLIRRHPEVAAILVELEDQVLSGRTTASKAAEVILSSFRLRQDSADEI